MSYIIKQGPGQTIREAAEAIALSQGRTIEEANATFEAYIAEGKSIREAAFYTLFAPPWGDYPSKKPEFRNRAGG